MLDTIIQQSTTDDSDQEVLSSNANKRRSCDDQSTTDSDSLEDPVADFTATPQKIRRLSTLPNSEEAIPVEELTCVSKADLANLIRAVQSQEVALRNVTDQLNTVTSELRKVKVALRNVSEPEDTPKMISFKCAENLPLKTYEDLIMFEDLADVDEFKRFLLTIGGNSVQRMLANLVAAVYSTDLQVSTTWKGKRSPSGEWSKPPISTTKSPRIIAEVCLASYPRQTMADVLTMFKNYMMHALDRQKKALMASLPQLPLTPQSSPQLPPTPQSSPQLPMTPQTSPLQPAIESWLEANVMNDYAQ